MSETKKSATLTRRQSRALAALVEHATVEDAATACGIGASTIRRWLASDTDFTASVAAAQARVIEEAFARLAVRSSQAVETLERNLSSGSHSVEVRAALGWLSLLHKRSEASRYARMEQELEALHALIDAREEQ